MFRDRSQAGQELAERLTKYKDQDVAVFALPRGGVVIGAAIARKLDAPLDLIIARKISHPMSAEYAIGAVTENGDPIWNEAEVKSINQPWLAEQIAAGRAESRRRREAYLGHHAPLDVQGKTAIIADDGTATGLTMLAAVAELQKRQPKKIVVAVPVAPRDVIPKLGQVADEVICIDAEADFMGAIGNYYQEFPQLEDDDVRLILSDLKQS